MLNNPENLFRVLTETGCGACEYRVGPERESHRPYRVVHRSGDVAVDRLKERSGLQLAVVPEVTCLDDAPRRNSGTSKRRLGIFHGPFRAPCREVVAGGDRQGVTLTVVRNRKGEQVAVGTSVHPVWIVEGMSGTPSVEWFSTG